jgi:hypothetical protein
VFEAQELEKKTIDTEGKMIKMKDQLLNKVREKE